MFMLCTFPRMPLVSRPRCTSDCVNIVNRRREFFRATPLEVKAHLAELAGELLQFQDIPEALEYRQCLTRTQTPETPA
jgi:hypothetical protein